jgi:hypothetical protein
MNMSSLHEAVAGRHHVHLGDVIGIQSVRAVEWTRIGSGRDDDEVATIRRGRAQASGFNLMADRAGDAIGGGSVLWVIGAERQSREYFGLAVLGLIDERLQRYVAASAFVLDDSARFGVVETLAAHTALPVGIARGVGHDARAPLEADGHVFTIGSLELVVAVGAALGGAEVVGGAMRCGSLRARGIW